MDIKKLIEDLHGLLKQYGEKIPYGELVGAPCPYSRTGDLVWQDPEPYLIEQAANAITELLARAEAAEARAEKAEKIASDLCDDFTDFVTSGIRNAAPYCANRRSECVDGWGWCNVDMKTCRGFYPEAAKKEE